MDEQWVSKDDDWSVCGASNEECQCGLIWDHKSDRVVAHVIKEDDSGSCDAAEFQRIKRLIAKAPTLSAELAEVRRENTALWANLDQRTDEMSDARAALAEAVGLLREYMWNGIESYDGGACISCNWRETHTEGCKLAAFLAKVSR